MTLCHIDDFEQLTAAVPRPYPWIVIGVMPTADDYMHLGDNAYDAHHAFCYTVSEGPAEVWCPLTSVEGRFCPPELITGVINVIFTAVGANQLGNGDNLIVPFEYRIGDTDIVNTRDGVFWIGHPTLDPDNTRYQCYKSPHTWVLPVKWSSPLGWN